LISLSTGYRIYNGFDSLFEGPFGKKAADMGAESYAKGDSCGILLDTDKMALTFFKNRKLNGSYPAFKNLPGVPMILAVDYFDVCNILFEPLSSELVALILKILIPLRSFSYFYCI